MKYPLFCILTLSVLMTQAQSKISFEMQLDAGAVFSRSKPIVKKTQDYYIYDQNTGTYSFVPGTNYNYNEYEDIQGWQVGLALRTNYKIKRNFSLYGGMSFAYLEAKRRNTMTRSNPFPSGPTNFEFVTDEAFTYYNLEFPLGISYFYKKWSLDAGFIPSIIIDSKFKEIKDPFDPSEITLVYPWENNSSIPRPSTENKSNSYFSLSISPQYQLSKKIKIGIEYTHGLTKSYNTDAYSSEYYQGMKLSTLGFKLIYKLK